MLRFVAIALVLCGLGLLGAGWSLQDDYRPELVMLAVGGGLVSLVAGIVLFARTPRRAAQARQWPAFDEDAFARWRDEVLRNPLVVQPRRLVVVLRHFVVGLFVLMAAGMVASQPLAPTNIGIGALCLALAGVMFALFRNAGRRTVVRLDREGITRGDGRRLDWRNLLGLEYQLALSRRHQHEALWRITLHFAGDEAWVVPAQTTNLDEVVALLEAMPVPKWENPV